MEFRRLIGFLRAGDGGVKRRTIRAGVWVSLSSASVSSLAFVRMIILARLLTPEVFGVWAICMMFVRALDIFTETGFGAALIHRQQRFEQARDTAFTMMIVRGGCLALISLGMAPLVAAFFDQPEIRPLVMTLSIAFFLSGFLNLNAVYLQKELKYQRLVYVEQGQTILDFLVVLLLAYVYRDVWALTVAHVLGRLIAVLLSYALIPGRPRIAFDKKIAMELFHYGKYITGLAVILFVSTEVDNLAIGKLLGPESLGFYVLAFSLANLPATHFSKVLSKVLFPAYSKLQNDREALREAFSIAFEFVALVTVPLCGLFIVLAPEIISVVFGNQWMPAASVLQILAVYGCVRAVSGLNGYVYNAIGRPNIPFYLNATRLLVVVAIIYPLTITYGIVGTAIAVSAPLLLQFAVGWGVITTILNASRTDMIAVLGRTIVVTVLVAVVVAWLKGLWAQIGLGALSALILVGGIMYLALNIRQARRFYSLIARAGA